MAQNPTTRTIHLGTAHANPDSQPANPGDTIRWTPTPDNNNPISKIDFGANTSLIFANPPAPVGGNTRVWQGVLKSDAPTGTYKYIFNAGGGDIDPDIMINT